MLYLCFLSSRLHYKMILIIYIDRKISSVHLAGPFESLEENFLKGRKSSTPATNVLLAMCIQCRFLMRHLVIYE